MLYSIYNIYIRLTIHKEFPEHTKAPEDTAGCLPFRKMPCIIASYEKGLESFDMSFLFILCKLWISMKFRINTNKV